MGEDRRMLHSQYFANLWNHNLVRGQHPLLLLRTPLLSASLTSAMALQMPLANLAQTIRIATQALQSAPFAAKMYGTAVLRTGRLAVACRIPLSRCTSLPRIATPEIASTRSS